VWRNAAISKNGRYLAALADVAEPFVYVFDLASPSFESETYELYNPTYSQNGATTGEVAYADVMEFDYSGDYLVYDAFNELDNSLGDDLSYWDIGFLQFRENGAFTNGANAPISKLFSGLPENSSIGNPAFAKNSPFILAFDFYDGLNNRYDVLGVNAETGDYDVIIDDIGDFGWPNYARTDNAVILHAVPSGGANYNIYRQGLAADKISPQGNATLFTPNHVWGVWYADGQRSLQVGTLEQDNAFAALSIAPNPAADRVTVGFTAHSAGAVRLSVVSLLGVEVRRSAVEAQSGDNRFELNLQGLPAGTYVVRLQSAQGVAAATVMVR
jgi:hypothetical protein